MTKFRLIGFLFFVFSVSLVQAQKVKYKDIFQLLSAKQYEQAEPFLKRYLKDNDDPSAFLYMGIIYQEKSTKTDVLKQTPIALSYMDSAIFFYSKAYTVIDEKEVRRNKEYYQVYNRRDLRTGEFGVKLSDIQFDIDKKKETLKERMDKVRLLKQYFALADSLYKGSNALFVSIKNRYGNERSLLLRADGSTVKELTTLSMKFDSCTKAFDNYKSMTTNLGRTGYNQIWSLTDIDQMEKQGSERADFYHDDLAVWNYKKFADEKKTILEKEIFPMREHLISYDVEINKLRDKLTTDSVSVRSDLTKLIDKLLYDQLRKFDEDPLPMDVFTLKTADLEYRSVLLENKKMQDTSDFHLRIKALTNEMVLLRKLDSVATRITPEKVDQKARDYEHFITNTYSTPVVLKSYVKTLADYAARQTKEKQDALDNAKKAMDWIIDGRDSIPLHPSIANRYKPLFTADEKFTLGIHLSDSINADGYFYTITPTRKPEVKVVFPVDKTSFKERRMSSTKGLSYSDAGGQIYYVLVYSEQAAKDKYPATLAKIYRSDGLAWSNNYQLPFIPKELNLRQDTGELTIKNDTQVTVIDKNGKMVR
ncbi:MAG TPA: hypothetical protein VGD40_01980 [Chryseosolibacter sp.]